MKTTFSHFLKTTFLVFLCLVWLNIKGQDDPAMADAKKQLYNTVVHLDSVMFDAFNNRNLDTLRNIFSEDIEFYHDQGGLTNYRQNMKSFQQTFESERKVRRELVSQSVEVSPIQNYGAVETGVHRFYATEKGQKEVLSSEAKFITLWRLKDKKWQATRIISYSHQEYLK